MRDKNENNKMIKHSKVSINDLEDKAFTNISMIEFKLWENGTYGLNTEDICGTNDTSEYFEECLQFDI